VTIAGIDFSSRAVDIVLLDEDTDAASWHRFELQGQDAFDRARSVFAAMPGPYSTFWDEILAVGIEQPRGNHGVVHMARIQGAVLTCVPVAKLVQPWNPAGWRKTVGLSGNAPKEEVKAFAATRLIGTGWTQWRQPATQDFFDAYCIALATRTMLHRTEAAA
jgi:hypothetical protein